MNPMNPMAPLGVPKAAPPWVPPGLPGIPGGLAPSNPPGIPGGGGMPVGGAAAGFGAWRAAAQFANPAAMAALPALHGAAVGPAIPQYPPQYAGYAAGAQSFAGAGGPGAAGYGYGFGSMGPGFMAIPFANQMPSPFGASSAV